MAIIDGRAMLEVLTPRTCRELLATAHIGRVAVVVEGHPEVFPVAYALDGDTVVFRTDTGTKLHAAVHWPSVAFEVDEVDLTTGEAWSVLLVGPVTEVSDGTGLRRLRDLDLDSWVPGTGEHWLCITPDKLTGRRVRR
jgi:nitroimidazol reductase NimA-like FMN-containing flavoprotein (pyridoxamine 5'-phosphate oxidase superfamily)